MGLCQDGRGFGPCPVAEGSLDGVDNAVSAWTGDDALDARFEILMVDGS